MPSEGRPFHDHPGPFHPALRLHAQRRQHAVRAPYLHPTDRLAGAGADAQMRIGHSGACLKPESLIARSPPTSGKEALGLILALKCAYGTESMRKCVSPQSPRAPTGSDPNPLCPRFGQEGPLVFITLYIDINVWYCSQGSWASEGHSAKCIVGIMPELRVVSFAPALPGGKADKLHLVRWRLTPRNL
jgi:hypothetical protein